MTREYNRPIDEEAVLRLARQNVSPGAIGKLLKLSPQRVRAFLAANGITPAVSSRDPWKHRRDLGPVKLDEDRKYRMPPPRPDPMQAAKEAFVDAYLMAGKPARLVVTRDGMKLDGKEIGLNALMRKTNAMRAAWGMEQIVTNPAWQISVERRKH